MISTAQKDKIFRLSKWIVFCLCFCALPLALIWVGLENSQDRVTQIKNRFVLADLQKQLEEIDQKAAYDNYFFNWLLQIEEKISGLAERKKDIDIQKYLFHLKKRFPGLFDFYFVDNRGDLVERFSSST